ncbi:unnamed protein product [Callosobruchus maculatus]|uniref:Uncharacterized protein n=1 Tax=Callosobruchus maculatus TaxID=64391 RepID=A0A653D0U5_CALMS|nr:unnamed protein product [Callosobruchus maculatus]
MIVDREHDNHREIKSIGRCEVVQSFVYLGSLIDNSGSCSTAHSTGTGGHDKAYYNMA